MAIKAVFWDVGGVLERTTDPLPRQQVTQQLGMTETDLSRILFGQFNNYQVQVGAITMEEHWRLVAGKLGVSRQAVDTIVKQFFAGDILDMVMIDYIRSLKEYCITGVISNYMPVLRSRVNELWGIGDVFDHLIISSEVGTMKPYPKIYHLALTAAGVAASEAVFIDDFEENVEGAINVGMHAIQFVKPRQTIADLHVLMEKDSAT